jgi:hypothetical protein
MTAGYRDGLGRPQQSRDLCVELLGETDGRFRYAGVEEVFRQASETVRAGAENFDILS